MVSKKEVERVAKAIRDTDESNRWSWEDLAKAAIKAMPKNADSERLDWINQNPTSVVLTDRYTYELLDERGNLVERKNLRAAIDAAMRQSKRGKRG